MAKEWFDYPLGAFRAAAGTAIGGILLAILAHMMGSFLYLMMDTNLKDGFQYFSFNPSLSDFGEFMLLLPFISAVGFLSLYGIPLVLIQLGCFGQIVWEQKVLHSWFVLAYCQVPLTYICLSAMEGYYEGLWGWHLASIAVSLLVLGVIHAFLVWLLRWRIRFENRASDGDVIAEEDVGCHLPLDEEKGQLVLPEESE